MPLSKSQIDRLGDRLRTGSLSESDLRALYEYRRSFRPAYDTVVETVRDRLGLEPTGRPGKSTGSLREKLQRESIRLVQVQDVAGCRVVVSDILEQDRAVASILEAFPDAIVVDRRATPSYGYRAVHVVVTLSGKMVEIQVRSLFQHLWAEYSEKLSDVRDPAIKYGGGSPEIREALDTASEAVERYEAMAKQIDALKAPLAGTPTTPVALELHKAFRVGVAEAEEEMLAIRTHLSDAFKKSISSVDNL